jgi:integrase
MYSRISAISVSPSESTLISIFSKLDLTITPHGLRATASTILNEANKFRSDVIERQLSHTEHNQVRDSYNQAEYIDGRRAMLWRPTLSIGRRMLFR